MLSRAEACRNLLGNDEAIRRAISVEGRAVFLALCAEAAIVRTELEDDDRRLCYRFLLDCQRFLKGEQIPANVFEQHVMNREGDSGFLFNSENDPGKKDYWLFLL